MPLFVIGGRQAGVLFTVALVGATEEDLPPHHSDAGAVAEDVFLLLCPDAANYRDAAGHELGEGIADPSEDPEFGGIEAGVMLRHRHPARPDVTLDIDLPLGHCVSRTVGGVAADGDLGAGVEPAHVVGGGAHDVDHGVGETHRADPLPRRPEYPERDLLRARPPEASADPVLTLGDDLDIAVSVRDGLLDSLFEDARFHPDPFFRPGNHDGWFW